MRTPLIILSLAIIGCGGKTGPDDPLTGTWSNAACYGRTGLPDNVQSCSTTLNFARELTFELVYIERAPPASSVTPGCLTTHIVSGQTWSEGIKNNAQTLTLMGGGKPTVAVPGCVHDTDDKGQTADASVTVAPGDLAYAINGKALTISTGSLIGTYTHD